VGAFRKYFGIFGIGQELDSTSFEPQKNKKMKKLFKLPFILPGLYLMSLLVLACNQGHESRLGMVDFVVTGQEEAQPAFKKGLLLLHSFEFVDAREQFRRAREIDPDFVMAYWGEAMTYHHLLWSFQDKEKALQVLDLLDPDPEARVALASTELEKDFISAVNIIYGDGPKKDRDRQYAEFMKSLYEKYPGNDEVASFYSVSLIGSVDSGRDEKIYAKAAEIAMEVIDRNPQHPGALHYLIHAYDDPKNAAKAIQTADKYSLVAPDAGHALHMPSHIYLALGLWDKVISSNEAAWQASLNRKEAKELDNDALNYHAFHWLLYGYLQVGRDQEARKLLEAMKGYCEELPSERAREHVVMMSSTYAAETGNYDEFTEITVNTDDMNVALKGMAYYTAGAKAYINGDAAGLEQIIAGIARDRMLNDAIVKDDQVRMCSGFNRSQPTALDVRQTEVMELELKAMYARLAGDQVKAYKLLQEAVDIELVISYAYGPPTVVKPSFDLYGEWLIEDGRHQEAIDYFVKSLEAAPGRKRTLSGKSKADSGSMQPES